MAFRPCIDFFRRGTKILFTKEGINKLKKTKLTGTKIPKFFQLKLILPDEEEESEFEEEEQTHKSEYKIWSQIFNFPFIPKRNPKKQEKYKKVEDLIKSYLEKELNKSWLTYPIDKYDIFESHDILGGVPDGEERDNNGKTVSILEIKTITDIKNKKDDSRFATVPLTYQLQLSLYLFLKGIDTGYICMCYMNSENWEDIDTIKLRTSLNKYSIEKIKISGELVSWIDEIGVCEYEYELLEARCNNFLEDNEILLFKVKINLDKFSSLLNKLCKWFVKYRSVSPDMQPSELEILVSKYKGW